MTITFDTIKKFYKEKGKLPSAISMDPEERKLQYWLGQRVRSKSCPKTFDQAIHAWFIEVKKNRPLEFRLQELKDFVDKNGKLPSLSAYDRKEQALARLYGNLVYPSCDRFNPEIREFVQKHTRVRPYEENWKACQDFLEEHGYAPSDSSKNPREFYLAKWLRVRATKTSKNYDPAIEEWWFHNRVSALDLRRFKALKLWYETYGKLPRGLKNPLERKLYFWMTVEKGRKLPLLVKWLKSLK